MTRRLPLLSGVLCISMGVTWMLPILFETSLGASLTETGRNVIWVGPALMITGLLLLLWSFQGARTARMPAPVRMALTGNVLFLAFCSLEFSDGLVRQDGRILYWTSYLFLPALLLFYGLVLARRWAWWGTRSLTASFALWFLGLAMLIPYGDVRAQGEPVSFWGRVYMVAITLAFAAVAVHVFRVLGHADSRNFFGIAVRPRRVD